MKIIDFDKEKQKREKLIVDNKNNQCPIKEIERDLNNYEVNIIKDDGDFYVMFDIPTYYYENIMYDLEDLALEGIKQIGKEDRNYFNFINVTIVDAEEATSLDFGITLDKHIGSIKISLLFIEFTFFFKKRVSKKPVKIYLRDDDEDPNKSA